MFRAGVLVSAALVTTVVVAVSAPPSIARADDAGSGSRGCALVTRENVGRCAVAASVAVRVAREDVSAAAGRRRATAPWFPSPPLLALSAGRRAGTEGRSDVLNYYATLAQEIELSGQRAARRRGADAELTARTADVEAVSRRTAAAAYMAYFDALSAREAVRVLRRLEETGRRIADTAAARADAGVGSPLDAEVASASALRLAQNRLASERAAATAAVTLAVLLGREPRSELDLRGALEPLAEGEAIARSRQPRDVAGRPEVRALEATRASFEARAEAFRRARYPNVTLQVFAQNDGYDERVVGAGLSVPLPLPQPVGRMYIGEIAESEALARRSGQEAELTRRELRGDLASAVVSYETRRGEADLYTEGRVARAERLLGEIAQEIDAGRLPVRDALLAQQQLIDVLRGAVETRRALCLASVELALAAGIPLDQGTR